MQELSAKSGPRFDEAVRFWEPRRMWYNAALFIVVLLWLSLTWPHFRPALTLEALGKMLVLTLLANVCYCAAYVVEAGIQAISSDIARRRFRWTVWILGMLLALLVENYWIADEIYPDIYDKQGTVMLRFSEMFCAANVPQANEFPSLCPALLGLSATPRDSLGNQSSDYQCDISSCRRSPYFVAHA